MSATPAGASLPFSVTDDDDAAYDDPPRARLVATAAIDDGPSAADTAAEIFGGPIHPPAREVVMEAPTPTLPTLPVRTAATVLSSLALDEDVDAGLAEVQPLIAAPQGRVGLETLADEVAAVCAEEDVRARAGVDVVDTAANGEAVADVAAVPEDSSAAELEQVREAAAELEAAAIIEVPVLDIGQVLDEASAREAIEDMVASAGEGHGEAGLTGAIDAALASGSRWQQLPPEEVDEPAEAAAQVDLAPPEAEHEGGMIGTVIDERYRLEKEIGVGGMSRVYEATHVRSAGKLAVKIVELDLSNKPETMIRCVQEARAMMDIRSNHIVRAHDVGVLATGELYVVMELLEGETLEQVLRRDGPIAWRRLGLMALQICNGLSACHKRGVFHRDIKPQNCMRVDLDDNADHIKLIDFGLARDIHGEPGVTQEGVLLGTPEYMAPELIASRATPDARSDVYALGATIFKLLTGEAVFGEHSPLDTLFHHKHTPPRVPSEVAPHRDIPEVADEIVRKALAKDPADRYPSAEALADKLRVVFGRPRTIPPNATDVTVMSGTLADRPVTLPPVENRATVIVAGKSGAVVVAPPRVAVAAPRLAPAPVEEVSFPWWMVLSAGLMLGLIAVILMVMSSTSTPVGAPAVAKAPPREVVVPTRPVEPKPVETKPVEPKPVVVAPVVTPPLEPDEPERVDEAPVAAPPVVKRRPVVKPAPEVPSFNYAKARALVEEQNAYLRKTCMVRGATPLKKLQFRVEVRANGHARIDVDGDPGVRGCVRTALAFVFARSSEGGAFMYTVTDSGSSLKPL